MLGSADKVIAALRHDNEVIAVLRAQLVAQSLELADTREDAKNANAHASRLLEELRTSGVKDLRKRLQAKTEKCTELERELEKLKPAAVKLDVRPRVVGMVKP